MSAQVILEEAFDRPRPAPDLVNAEYFAACTRGELLIQQCGSCGHRQHYPRALCTECGEEPGWLAVSGRGTVYTFTIIRQMGAPGFIGRVPYVVAMIALEEGPMLMGNVTGIDVDAMRIGLAVEVYMVQVDPKIAIPFWRPAPTT